MQVQCFPDLNMNELMLSIIDERSVLLPISLRSAMTSPKSVNLTKAL